MDIVILHCHFERGGVTQVVENHVRSLTDVSGVNRIFLVSGDEEDFDYDPESLPVASAEDRSAVLASRLDGELVGAGIRPDASILHWHNHSLGKNTAAPGVIRRLASAGWRFLLQIHDFAEDYRPENYRRLIDATTASTPGASPRARSRR